MDFVDETRGKYVKLEDIGLTEAELFIFHKIINRISDRELYYMKLDRGLSGESKIIVKPSSLFPLLVKIGDSIQIKKEYDGYQLLHLRIPAFNVPHLIDTEFESDKSALVYRYITRGLVKDPVSRLDVYISEDLKDIIVPVLIELFDVILKKCHWLDGHFKMKQVCLPMLEDPQTGADPIVWNELFSYYEWFKNQAKKYKSPHGIVHGDLHPKNILIARNNLPIIIDYSMANTESCVYIDYAKLEVHLQFQVSSVVSDGFWHVSERMYSNGPLILPRSNKVLATCIHAIRSTLWKICLSKKVGLLNDEIDFGYRSYLLYYLIRFWSKTGISNTARDQALKEIRSLVKGFCA